MRPKFQRRFCLHCPRNYSAMNATFCSYFPQLCESCIMSSLSSGPECFTTCDWLGEINPMSFPECLRTLLKFCCQTCCKQAKNKGCRRCKQVTTKNFLRSFPLRSSGRPIILGNQACTEGIRNWSIDCETRIDSWSSLNQVQMSEFV